MPLGLKRYQQSGQSHFVTFSCYHRLPYLSGNICDVFLSSLEQRRRQYRFLVYGYVVMHEHVHLLVSEPEAALLSTALQSLKLSVARRAVRTGGPAPLWQKRYYDHNVRNYESFVQKLRYMHRNPVKRGLCDRPEDWRWSSYRHYAEAEVGPVEIESEWTAMRRAGKDPHLPDPHLPTTGRCGAPSPSTSD
jgi:putative transposase